MGPSFGGSVRLFEVRNSNSELEALPLLLVISFLLFLLLELHGGMLEPHSVDLHSATCFLVQTLPMVWRYLWTKNELG